MLSRIFNAGIPKKVISAIFFAAILMLMSVVLAKIFSDLAFADERLSHQGVTDLLVHLLN